MSLKAFHIFFIGASALLCFGIGLVRGMTCLEAQDLGPCVQAAAAVIAGLGLVAYGINFLKKTKWLGYL